MTCVGETISIAMIGISAMRIESGAKKLTGCCGTHLSLCREASYGLRVVMDVEQ